MRKIQRILPGQVRIAGIGEFTALVDTGAQRTALLRRHAPVTLQPLTEAPFRSLGGSALPVDALDLHLQSEAGSKILLAVPVFGYLPTVMFLTDYLLSGKVPLTVDGSSVNFRSVVASTTSAQGSQGEPATLPALSAILERNGSLFADTTAQLPGTSSLEHHIPTDTHPLVSVPLRRYAERERAVIAEQVQELLAANVIRPS